MEGHCQDFPNYCITSMYHQSCSVKKTVNMVSKFTCAQCSFRCFMDFLGHQDNILKNGLWFFFKYAVKKASVCRTSLLLSSCCFLSALKHYRDSDVLVCCSIVVLGCSIHWGTSSCSTIPAWRKQSCGLCSGNSQLKVSVRWVDWRNEACCSKS